MFRKSGLLMVLICFIVMMCISQGADAEQYIDLRNSQEAYGKTVARLAEECGLRTRGAKKVIVLIKTDGNDVPLDELGVLLCVQGPGNRMTLQFDSQDAADNAVRVLRDKEHIIYAEQDGEVISCDTAETEEIAFCSYGADTMGFGPLLSWAKKEDRRVTVAVIDSGVGYHSDLSSRVYYGWDYVDQDDDPSNDEYGHGTHVAGIVADCTKGTSVMIYAVRILNSAGKGNISNAINAILDAAEEGVPVINLSFVSRTESSALDEAVLAAVQNGSTVIIAAGNDGINTTDVWPAHLTTNGVIVTGALDTDGNRASYSNYGSSVDFYVFGSNVSSCLPGGGYTTRTGTSQAAPHISAACALLKMLYGDPPAALESRMKHIVKGNKGYPDLQSCVPTVIPCRLTDMKLGLGESVFLPLHTLQEDCPETVRWISMNEQVIQISSDGEITAVGCGETVLIRECRNFPNSNVSVVVTNTLSHWLILPGALSRIEAEAFQGVPADYIVVGENVSEIDGRAFDMDSIMICALNSSAVEIAEEAGWQYISR